MTRIISDPRVGGARRPARQQHAADVRLAREALFSTIESLIRSLPEPVLDPTPGPVRSG